VTAANDTASRDFRRQAHDWYTRPRFPPDDAPRVEWALAVARIGLRVHPLHWIRDARCACGKDCGRSAGKHPRLAGWQTKATTSETLIRTWWGETPDANIGIATGEGSDVCILDIDGDEGRASLGLLPPIPRTLTVETGGGGLHRFFRYPHAHGDKIANTVSKLAPSIDVRTERGNLVGPGSVHKSGRRYRVVDASPIAAMPDWLVERLVSLADAPETYEPQPTPEHRDSHDNTVPEAERIEWARAYARKIHPSIEGSHGDDWAFVAAFKVLRGFDLTEAVTFQILLDEWNPRCIPPWRNHELYVLRRKVREAATKGRMPWGQLWKERFEREQARRRGAQAPPRDAPRSTSSPSASSPTSSTTTPRQPTTPREVLARLAAQGPAIHLPTGIEPLDAFTMGGPRFGDFVTGLGAPDAAKTLLVLHMAEVWATQGVCVGILAVDEDDEGFVTRLAQRRGWHRREVEQRERFDELATMMPDLVFFDDSRTLTEVIEDLAAHACDRPAVLIIDSLQAIAEGELERSTPKERTTMASAVSSVVAKLKKTAVGRRWLVISTSEMNRDSYSGLNRVDALAAGKWSGSIEYKSRLQFALTQELNHPNLIKVEIKKNKLGPSNVSFFIAIDRARQTIAVADEPERPKGPDNREQTLDDAAAYALELAERQPASAKDMYAAMKNRLSTCGHPRADQARIALGKAVETLSGRQGYVLHGVRIPPDVLDRIPEADRDRIRAVVPHVPPRPAPSRDKSSVSSSTSRPAPSRGTGGRHTHHPDTKQVETQRSRPARDGTSEGDEP
jgi:hypothetical protein